MSTILHKTMHATFRRTSNPTGPTRSECWGAIILANDGTLWEADRTEEPGTPWHLTRVIDGVFGGTYGSLTKCRDGVTKGYASETAAAMTADGYGHHARMSTPVRWLFEAMARRTVRDYLRSTWAA